MYRTFYHAGVTCIDDPHAGSHWIPLAEIYGKPIRNCKVFLVMPLKLQQHIMICLWPQGPNNCQRVWPNKLGIPVSLNPSVNHKLPIGIATILIDFVYTQFSDTFIYHHISYCAPEVHFCNDGNDAIDWHSLVPWACLQCLVDFGQRRLRLRGQAGLRLLCRCTCWWRPRQCRWRDPSAASAGARRAVDALRRSL